MTARAPDLRLYALVAAIAFAARFVLVLRSAGPFGSYGYDSGVYYAAADALLHGRVPYRDFVLLHPPAAMLALTPSALLGHLTTDRTGFLSAQLLFTLLGAVNAALVVDVARRWGLPRRAAVAGGLFYAVWLGAAAAEYLSRLEPLGNFFLLLTLREAAVAADRSGTPRRRALIGAGVAAALAVSTKIWFVVPAAIVLGWAAWRCRGRALGTVAAAAAATVAVLDGPFLALSRGAMFSRVVVDQLGRKPQRMTLTGRMTELTGAARLPGLGHQGTATATVLLAGLALLVVLVALRSRPSRLFGVLALADVAVLLAAPSWFAFYADFAALPVALCVAGAAGAAGRLRRPQHALAWASAAAAAAVTASVAYAGTFHATSSWHGADRLASAVRPLRCVMSDAPSGLIELDKLDSDLSHGCPNWVDVTGRTYFGADRSAAVRAANRRWQRDLTRYLLSGQAAFIVRASGDGMTPATRHAVERDGPLAGRGAVRVWATGRRFAAGRR
jgi:hypothetical protein